MKLANDGLLRLIEWDLEAKTGACKHIPHSQLQGYQITLAYTTTVMGYI